MHKNFSKAVKGDLVECRVLASAPEPAADPLGLDDEKPLLACRGCLAIERPLRPLQHALATAYGELTGTTVSESDIYPKFLCSYCRALLLKFAAFRERCLYVQNTFFNLHSVGVPVTPDLLKSSATLGAPYPYLVSTYIQQTNLDESEKDNSTVNIRNQIKKEHFGTTQPDPTNIFDDFLVFNKNVQIKEDNDVEMVMDATVIPSGNGNSDAADDNSSGGTDMPDCLVGINSDIYKKDTKKAFKDELACSKVKSKPKKELKRKVQNRINESKDYCSENKLEELKEWVSSLKRKRNASANTATEKPKLPMPGNNATDDCNIVTYDMKHCLDSGSDEDVSDDGGEDTDTKESLAGTSNDANPFTSKTESNETKTVKASNAKKRTKKVSVKSHSAEFSLKGIKKWIEGLKARKREEKMAKKLKITKIEKLQENRRLHWEKTCNVKIVQLSKEDQVKQIRARKDRTNYTHATYKCQMCYRGFNVEFTFKNHIKSHEVSHGDYVCDVCNLRYRTKARLDKHMLGNHMYDYICNECGFISKSSAGASLHYKWHKGIKYNCKICGKLFNKPTSVLGHMHLSHGGDMKCSICDETFIGRNGLNSHMKISHKEAVGAVCPDCGVQFHSGDALRTHRPLDGPCDQTLRACAACGEAFRSEELLVTHKLKQHKVTYQCNICSKSFFVMHKYRSHMKICQGTSKKYYERSKSTTNDPATHATSHSVHMCEICGYTTKIGTNFQRHHLIHTGEKPYQCDHCGECFRVKQSLQTHIMVKHMGVEKPKGQFKCRFCQKTFTEMGNRRRHELMVHQNIRPFKCDSCEKTYQDKCGLQIHINTKHLGQPWPKRIRKRRRPNE